ncbi:diguanylate cyclase [Erwinia sp. OLTSP20]|uniref:sensor domain-containing diguanylate cyclase n=1 Tax=unclassified Erwinia TaxID=2622719 RepID=UPI000C17D581|nr:MULTISPECIES: sensor domain-containing diguanylate cyclase [unclassified Erwinia]PIJ51593.1 diguanylate cyclase [Erwinia sp. OAMSP11]PIJ68915.1 diguanylate cyclase [Erwinia sp. OLSSP12]PIJ83503.1 diguanylate cyclase [Erwinia sp. OLCASP19]PIJ83573.1 diguanylate cyclase [Erwinia sp. OLMDSP33]PIJ86336.1 diguanylate cyclase [Erwinia sp. OLMTSP26]
MLRSLRPKTDLKTLITLLVVASIVITLANALYATRRVQQTVLINNALEANRVYATKLASTTEIFFQQAQSQLAWSANGMGKAFSNTALLQQEVQRLRTQTNSFNSVAVVDARSVVLAASSESSMLEGKQLHTDATRQALTARRPLISKPSLSATGNLIVLISWPVTAPDGRYLGYVGGTIYLKKHSVLNALLEEQFYRDGTRLFVTDEDNRMLYHQHSEMIGRIIEPFISPQLRAQQSSGYQQVVRANQDVMLAGYAIVPVANWTIVALKPRQTTLAPLDTLLLQVLKHSVPLALLTLVLALLLARLIALPLWQLARKAGEMDVQGVSGEIEGIRSWYFEALQIKRAILTGISLLQDKIGRLRVEVQTDPMTQLLNRRGLNAVLEYFLATQQSFAVLAMDIDHFKRVNDSFGHDVGDLVLQSVARQMEACSRKSDVICRNGGEEFLMILPGATQETALSIAERLREQIAQQALETVGHITISIGVAFWHPQETTLEHTFKLADAALYQAKEAGRNRVIMLPAGS